MAAEKGRKVLIQTSTDTSPATFETLGGIQTDSCKVNGQAVDVTNMDSDGWQELLEGGGTTKVEISGDGIWEGDDQIQLMTERAMQKTIDLYKLPFEGGDFFLGSFQCTDFEHTGGFDKPRQWKCTLTSSGVVTYTPAA
jgi:predicted secreted protein